MFRFAKSLGMRGREFFATQSWLEMLRRSAIHAPFTANQRLAMDLMPPLLSLWLAGARRMPNSPP